MERYNGLLVNRNREVLVLDPQGEFRGISRGVNEEGLLPPTSSVKSTHSMCSSSFTDSGILLKLGRSAPGGTGGGLCGGSVCGRGVREGHLRLCVGGYSCSFTLIPTPTTI